jgi:hypothetical protein
MRNTQRFTRVLPTVLLLAGGVLSALFAACGGYGGSSGSSSGGGTSCGGAYGGSCPPPTVSVSAPTANATVDRTVDVTATAAATSGASLTQVEFEVDGANIGKATAAPYAVKWDSTTVTDGKHSLTAVATDNQGHSTTATAVSVNVLNNPAFKVSLAAAQIFPAPNSTATGTANLSAKLATGALTGKVTLTGVTATAVSINEAFAGNTGSSLVALTSNAGTPGEWDVPGGVVLTSDQITALSQGKLYVLVSSAANSGGELRGQILPGNVMLVFTTLSGSQEVPAVSSAGSGVAATTVDSNAGTLSEHVHVAGITPTGAAVDTAASGATGPQLVALTQDNSNADHWATELAPIASADMSNFTAGKWYVNVDSAAHASGELRGQIQPGGAAPPPATPTFTQIRAAIFDKANCALCHTGGGAQLPSAMDLHDANIYASIVNVASIEVPNLKRIAPGDPNNSYLVQKLEGTAAVGARMPLGGINGTGQYFDQATIDMLKAWVTAGAPNN